MATVHANALGTSLQNVLNALGGAPRGYHSRSKIAIAVFYSMGPRIKNTDTVNNVQV